LADLLPTFTDGAFLATKGERALRKAIENFGSERGENTRKEVLKRGLPLTMENLSKYYDMPLKEA